MTTSITVERSHPFMFEANAIVLLQCTRVFPVSAQYAGKGDRLAPLSEEKNFEVFFRFLYINFLFANKRFREQLLAS